MLLVHVVGARPNFMKLAPVHRAIAKIANVEQLVVHTGQHYDVNMSDVFFQQLQISPPDINLQVGSGTHAKQTAEIMARFEDVVVTRRPDLVLVYGDVNSTVAAALVCKTADSCRPRGGWAAIVRPIDAGRNQPPHHRSTGGLAVYAIERWESESGA